MYDVTLLGSKRREVACQAVPESLSLSVSLEVSLATVAIHLPLRQMEDAEDEWSTGWIGAPGQ